MNVGLRELTASTSADVRRPLTLHSRCHAGGLLWDRCPPFAVLLAVTRGSARGTEPAGLQCPSAPSAFAMRRRARRRVYSAAPATRGTATPVTRSGSTRSPAALPLLAR
jgi:hypothetical protein